VDHKQKAPAMDPKELRPAATVIIAAAMSGRWVS